jgi:hypothetical protein
MIIRKQNLENSRFFEGWLLAKTREKRLVGNGLDPALTLGLLKAI